VVTGAIPVATELLAQHWDHIVYTGGTAGAQFVTAAAAKTLTPYTLELGGKNPCVVDASVSDAKLEIYAQRIVWGKFSNAGQICIGSDHVITVGSPEEEERFLVLIKKAARKFTYGGDMSRIINQAHFDRLQGLLQRSKGQVVFGGDFDRETKRIGLTVVQGVEFNDSLMGDEIFGPILPMVRVDTLDAAVSLIKSRDHPLALYSSPRTLT
jgi:aldehyde dehydrogenase (NAD+)